MQRANDRLTPATRAALTPGGSLWGSPSTILVLGSDARPGETSSRSDSILLIRVDPSRQQIAELSIPRDLRTEIPGHGSDKINAAYAFGGPPLAIKTVENLTGLKVNHVVLVNFAGLREADRRARRRHDRQPDEDHLERVRRLPVALRPGTHPPRRPARARLLARPREHAQSRPTTTSRADSASSAC